MYNLDKKIDEYSEELFTDLGLTALPEEAKADIYARVQDHLHRVIIDTLSPLVRPADAGRIKIALGHEDYRALDIVVRRYPQFKDEVQTKIDQKFVNLKQIIAEEQQHARYTN